MRLLVDDGQEVDRKSAVVVDSAVKGKGEKGLNGEEHTVGSSLAVTNELLRWEKLTTGEDATQDQLPTWQAIRRLLVRVEAVRALSWLWPSRAPCLTHAAEGTSRSTASTPLTLMLPLVGRTAGARRALLRSLFRWAGTLAVRYFFSRCRGCIRCTSVFSLRVVFSSHRCLRLLCCTCRYSKTCSAVSYLAGGLSVGSVPVSRLVRFPEESKP